MIFIENGFDVYDISGGNFRRKKYSLPQPIVTLLMNHHQLLDDFSLPLNSV